MTSWLSLTPIPCATLCGAASHHRPALVRYAGLQAGLGSSMYPPSPRGSENDAAMHTTVLWPACCSYQRRALAPTLTLALARKRRSMRGKNCTQTPLVHYSLSNGRPTGCLVCSWSRRMPEALSGPALQPFPPS